MQGEQGNSFHFSSPFVGRREEIALFKELTQRILTDGRYLLLISGQPGVGKSRLLEEMYKSARRRKTDGVEPLLARYRFREETSLPESAVWERILENLHTEASAKTVIDQFRLLCRTRPIILFIDNVHLGGERFFIRLDDLLEELRDLPFLAVCAYRELPVYRGRFLSFLSEIKPLTRVIEHRLENLSERETGLLIEKIIGEEPSRWLVKKTVEQTDGTPLFIQEIGRLIDQYRKQYEDDFKRLWECEVPKAAHKAIARRLANLSQGCLQKLQMLSLTGENYSENEIETMCLDSSIDLNTWMNCLQEAIDYGFIRTDGTGGKYRFSHNIVREAVTASIPETKVGAIARETALKLEAAGLAEKEEWALRLAGLWRRVTAKEAGNGYRRYIRKAAKSALEQGEYELAADLLEKIIDPAIQSVQTDEEAELLYDYAEAKSYSGYRAEAVKYFDKNFRYYQEQENINGMIRIASRTEYIRTGEPGYVDYYEDIFRILPSKSIEWVKLMYQYAFYLLNKIGNFENIEGILQKVDSINIKGEVPEKKLYSILAHACIDNVSMRFDDSIQKTYRGISDFKGVDPFSETALTGIHLMCLTSLGRYKEALRKIPSFLHVASKLDDGYTLVYVYHHIGRLKAASGEWREACEYFETGASYYPYLPELLAWRASIEYMLGNIDRGDMYRRRLLRIYRRVPEGPFKHPIYVSYTAAVRALCSGEAGDIAKWVPIIQSIAADTSAHPFISIRAHLCLLLSGIILQNPRLIKNAVTVLEKPSRYYLIRPYKIRWALGLGKRQLRRTEEAISHFRDALSSARWYGDKPLEACILYDLGRSLFLEHDDTESRNMTIDLLQEARKLSCNIGMASLTERIDEITREIGITESLSIGTLRPLTKRERGVAACLEQGLSNKEIAENLSISVHTVINHIRHICEKTGTSSRGAAVAAIKRAESIRNTFP